MTYSISPVLTTRQNNIIAGTIMGGSSLVMPSKGKNCYLSMRDKRKEWLAFKSTELATIASDSPVTVEKTFRWHSKCYPILNTFKDRFYKNGERHLSIESIDQLNDVAFAIWLGDCGYVMKNDIVVLRTQMFSVKDCLRVKLDPDGSSDFLKYAVPHMPHWMVLPRS